MLPRSQMGEHCTLKICVCERPDGVTTQSVPALGRTDTEHKLLPQPSRIDEPMSPQPASAKTHLWRSHAHHHPVSVKMSWSHPYKGDAIRCLGTSQIFNCTEEQMGRLHIIQAQFEHLVNAPPWSYTPGLQIISWPTPQLESHGPAPVVSGPETAPTNSCLASIEASSIRRHLPSGSPEMLAVAEFTRRATERAATVGHRAQHTQNVHTHTQIVHTHKNSNYDDFYAHTHTHLCAQTTCKHNTQNSDKHTHNMYTFKKYNNIFPCAHTIYTYLHICMHTHNVLNAHTHKCINVHTQCMYAHTQCINAHKQCINGHTQNLCAHFFFLDADDERSSHTQNQLPQIMGKQIGQLWCFTVGLAHVLHCDSGSTRGKK